MNNEFLKVYNEETNTAACLDAEEATTMQN